MGFFFFAGGETGFFLVELSWLAFVNVLVASSVRYIQKSAPDL